MKTLRTYLWVLLLSVIHVHLSINTQDNGLNPLTFFVLLNSYSSWLNEKDALILGGIIIQSLVTMGIACYYLRWNKYLTWIVNIALCIPIGFLLEKTFCMILQPFEGLNSFYQRLYDTELPDMCAHAFLFSTIQILLIALYPLKLYLFQTNRIRWLHRSGNSA
jgi:hypothetical protein